MKIVWTKEALDRLAEIEKYIALDNPKRARGFIVDLMGEASALAKNSMIGRVVPEISNPAIRERIYQTCRIVYRLGEGRIEILTVFEGHRLWRSPV